MGGEVKLRNFRTQISRQHSAVWQGNTLTHIENANTFKWFFSEMYLLLEYEVDPIAIQAYHAQHGIANWGKSLKVVCSLLTKGDCFSYLHE
jgi:hypothetical protein